MGTAFTYQGRLTDGSQPTTGHYDFLFRLYDAPAGGNQVGPLLATNAVPVSEGLFVVELNFGAGAFPGEARWLQISVQTNGAARFTLLTPRQPLTPAPQAQLALTVPDGVITGAKLAPGAVQAIHLQAGAVTSGHLAAGAVQASNIVSGAITSTQLAVGAVQSNHLAPAAIAANHLAPGAAAANLAASGQTGVGTGGIILSANENNAALAAAGYVRIGKTTLGEESWEAYATPETRYWSKTGHSTVWTGTEMIAVGGDIDDGTPWAVSYDPALDSWTSLPDLTDFGVTVNKTLPAVWTGTELIVFSDFGHYTWSGTESNFTKGAIYNPQTQSWRPTSPNNAPVARRFASVVWTGSEVLLWGGESDVWVWSFGQYTRMTLSRNDGGRYVPATDTWLEMSGDNAPSSRSGHTAVWTGSEMVIWGGQSTYANMDFDACYRPATDSWRAMSTNNGPPAGRTRIGHSAVWTGTEMIVWGGSTGPWSVFADGGRYRPDLDAWVPIPTNAVPIEPRRYHSAVWTGSRVLIWGGDGAGSETVAAPAQGAAYDPTADTWTLLPLPDAPVPRGGHTAIWTGSEMIVWGGRQRRDGFDYHPDLGGHYRPASDTWQPTAPTGEHRQRAHHCSVWTGTELIVWGGWDGEIYLGSGERYHPALNTWQPLPMTNAPSGRQGHTAVWTSSEMLVWGGYDRTRLQSGGRYQVAADAWLPISTNGAPVARRDHTAVWTGYEMVVWGGRAASPQNTGGRYQPATDTWTTVATAGAPNARFGHTAVWTGEEMIAWGGRNLIGYFFDGGRYVPGNNTWTTLPNAPTLSGREGHAAVWTGNEMIVWGGFNGATNLQTGGRYSPVANTWTEMSVQNAPEPRRDHTLVWDGTHVIVWGGENGGAALKNGGRYDPLTDTWTAIPNIGESPRCSHHQAVWAGTAMLIHGGFDGFLYSRSLHGYSPARQVYLYLKP